MSKDSQISRARDANRQRRKKVSDRGRKRLSAKATRPTRPTKPIGGADRDFQAIADRDTPPLRTMSDADRAATKDRLATFLERGGLPRGGGGGAPPSVRPMFPTGGGIMAAAPSAPMETLAPPQLPPAILRALPALLQLYQGQGQARGGMAAPAQPPPMTLPGLVR
jgi:hypothetical protein